MVSTKPLRQVEEKSHTMALFYLILTIQKLGIWLVFNGKIQALMEGESGA